MFTFNGVGTTLYGHRNPQPDGSYIATKWLVVLYIPFIPLASYRVWRGETSFRVLGTNTDYRLEPLPLQWRQVLNWYLATLFFGPFLLWLFGSGLLIAVWQAWRP